VDGGGGDKSSTKKEEKHNAWIREWRNEKIRGKSKRRKKERVMEGE